MRRGEASAPAYSPWPVRAYQSLPHTFREVGAGEAVVGEHLLAPPTVLEGRTDAENETNYLIIFAAILFQSLRPRMMMIKIEIDLGCHLVH